MFKRGEKTQSMRNSVGRAIFAGVALLLQIWWLVSLAMRANAVVPYVSIVTRILSLVCALNIYGQERVSASKTGWIALILLMPVLGLCLYVLVGQPWATYSIRRRFERIDRHLAVEANAGAEAIAEAQKRDPDLAGNLRYIRDWGKYPAWLNTQVDFHASGEAAFEDLKACLRRAKKFIFMEYHAIELSTCFMELEEILAERAAAGVEVRLFYDDVGSLSFICPHFIDRMQQKGIRCRVFNPIVPLISVFMNNRDHRKITVIDGQVGFTGGYNLADEYFNVKHPYGHWKDTGVKLTGSAVWNLTQMFLEMWNAMGRTDEDCRAYLAAPAAQIDAPGIVAPYADSPLDDERVGECVYMNLLRQARRRCWITTPYLILDDEMTQALILAAKRGVDVRIITPGIPDKKLVFQITRSYYGRLARGGVRIYEYAPGFIHAKQMLADDDTAVVGTVNLDFRSLYLHFEDAVLFSGCPAVQQVSADFDATLALCREVTQASRARQKPHVRVIQKLLRLFAPLL